MGQEAQGNKMIHSKKWQWEYNTSKFVGHDYSSAEGLFTALSSHIRKEEMSQVNNKSAHSNWNVHPTEDALYARRNQDSVVIAGEIDTQTGV